jgi:hypothetical protein
MQIQVGLTLKEGRDHFGSEAATCHVVLDVPDTLIGDGFAQTVRTLFAQCRASVKHELARNRPGNAPQTAREQGSDDDRSNGQPRRDDRPQARQERPEGNGKGASPLNNPQAGPAIEAPATGLDFWKWEADQDERTKRAIKDAVRELGLSSWRKQWSDDEAVAVFDRVQQLLAAPPKRAARRTSTAR